MAGAGPKLAEIGFRVIALDLRGHGESDWSPDGRYAIESFVEDLRAACASLGREVVLVGASLGGLSSLLAAGEAPRVAARAVVLVDIAHRPEPVGVSRIVAFMSRRPEGFATLEEAAAMVSEYFRTGAPPQSSTASSETCASGTDGGSGTGTAGCSRASRPFRTCKRPPTAASPRHARSIRPILVVRGTKSDVLSIEIAREFCEHVPRASWSTWRMPVTWWPATAMTASSARSSRFFHAPTSRVPDARERTIIFMPRFGVSVIRGATSTR